MAGSLNLELLAVPLLPGTLTLPLLRLLFEKPEDQASDSDLANSASAYPTDRRLELITNAQCYNYSQWQTVEVLDTR